MDKTITYGFLNGFFKQAEIINHPDPKNKYKYIMEKLANIIKYGQTDYLYDNPIYEDDTLDTNNSEEIKDKEIDENLLNLIYNELQGDIQSNQDKQNV